MLWLFSPSWGAVDFDLEAGFVCPFVAIDPANLEEKIVVSQVFCFTILKLCFNLVTSAWILSIYAVFHLSLEFVGFFFEENHLFLGENFYSSCEKSGRKIPAFSRQTASKWRSTIFLWKISGMNIHIPLPPHQAWPDPPNACPCVMLKTIIIELTWMVWGSLQERVPWTSGHEELDTWYQLTKFKIFHYDDFINISLSTVSFRFSRFSSSFSINSSSSKSTCDLCLMLFDLELHIMSPIWYLATCNMPGYLECFVPFRRMLEQY